MDAKCRGSDPAGEDYRHRRATSSLTEDQVVDRIADRAFHATEGDFSLDTIKDAVRVALTELALAEWSRHDQAAVLHRVRQMGTTDEGLYAVWCVCGHEASSPVSPLEAVDIHVAHTGSATTPFAHCPFCPHPMTHHDGDLPDTEAEHG